MAAPMVPSHERSFHRDLEVAVLRWFSKLGVEGGGKKGGVGERGREGESWRHGYWCTILIQELQGMALLSERS
jgi:hypothetical protein